MTDRDGEAVGHFVALRPAINAAAEPWVDVRRTA